MTLIVLSAIGTADPARAQDPAAGKAVFTSQCAVCHPIQSGRNSVGPSLFGIVGRKTGSVPGFHYSAANSNANIVWDEATLNNYLKAPMTAIPGTTMGYAGLKDDAQRANLVAYLATLK
ncbi:MAG: cytochrome c family protein [Rhodopila sp.]